jgi:hypothetical protein
MIINPFHTTNYNYEFDLVQDDRHRIAMDTRFDAGQFLCRTIGDGEPPNVEALPGAIMPLDSLSGTPNDPRSTAAAVAKSRVSKIISRSPTIQGDVE